MSRLGSIFRNNPEGWIPAVTFRSCVLLSHYSHLTFISSSLPVNISRSITACRLMMWLRHRTSSRKTSRAVRTMKPHHSQVLRDSLPQSAVFLRPPLTLGSCQTSSRLPASSSSSAGPTAVTAAYSCASLTAGPPAASHQREAIHGRLRRRELKEGGKTSALFLNIYPSLIQSCCPLALLELDPLPDEVSVPPCCVASQEFK